MKVKATSKPVKVEQTYDVLLTGLTQKQVEFLKAVSGNIAGKDAFGGREMMDAICISLDSRGVQSRGRDWFESDRGLLVIRKDAGVPF